MPSSPSVAGTNTASASPEKISPSALTMSTWMVLVAMIVLAVRTLAQGLGFLDGLVDGADHVERLLGQVVVVAVQDALEAADGLGQRDDLAVLAGEHLGHVERL